MIAILGMGDGMGQTYKIVEWPSWMTDMLLYHCSGKENGKPRIIGSSRTLDFGPGFYTTPYLDRAVQFSRKVALRTGGAPVVHRYHLDEAVLQSRSILRFQVPDGDWLDFVITNRQGRSTTEGLDIIIGSVADDDMYGTIGMYEAGFLGRGEVLRRLNVSGLSDQYVFVSEESLSDLVYLGVEPV